MKNLKFRRTVFGAVVIATFFLPAVSAAFEVPSKAQTEAQLCVPTLSGDKAIGLFSIENATQSQTDSIHRAIRGMSYPWGLLIEPLGGQKIRVVFQPGDFTPFAGKRMMVLSQIAGPDASVIFILELAHIVDDLTLTTSDRNWIIDATGGRYWLNETPNYADRVGEWFMYHFAFEWGGADGLRAGPSFGSLIPPDLEDEFVRIVTTPRFYDVPRNYVHYDGIDYLTGIGMVNGYGDCTFRPNKPITRAEFAVLIVRALDLSLTGNPDAFNDDNGMWYEPYINALAAKEIVNGYAPGEFRPEKIVARGEAAKILTLAFNVPLDAPEWFNDDNGVWYEQYANALRSAGISFGCDFRVFCGELNLTRGEMASMLMRSLT